MGFDQKLKDLLRLQIRKIGLSVGMHLRREFSG